MTSKTDNSWNLRRQACIAQNALTNSKRPECFVKGVYPTDLKKASGPYVWDTSENRYMDFICGLGSSILGFSNISVIEGAYRGLALGSTLSLSTPYEVELAEKIKSMIPFIDKMKFLKTGSDACTAALKIARTKTQRVSVLSEGYHGWHDPFVSLTSPAFGLAPQVGISKLTSIDDINRSHAAVILEPIMTDMSDSRIKFLRDLRKKCTENEVMLIFDEVITGFRFPKFCVSSFLGIEPDLICLGKAIANGLPLAVVAGKSDIMECGEYFVSSTFAGEMPSIFAALACLTELQKVPKFDMLYLWERGKYFIEKFNSFYPEKIRIQGYPTRGVFEGDPFTRALFFQEACLGGYLFGPSFFFNFSHLFFVETILNAVQDILTRIKTGSVELKGDLPKPPFAQTMRQK